MAAAGLAADPVMVLAGDSVGHSASDVGARGEQDADAVAAVAVTARGAAGGAGSRRQECVAALFGTFCIGGRNNGSILLGAKLIQELVKPRPTRFLANQG